MAVDRISHAATRQMVCCAVTGQAAGTAAALSAKENVCSSKVNVEKVRTRLEKQGVRTG